MKCVIFGGGGFIGSAIADRQCIPSNRMKNSLSKRYTHLNPTEYCKEIGASGSVEKSSLNVLG